MQVIVKLGTDMTIFTQYAVIAGDPSVVDDYWNEIIQALNYQLANHLQSDWGLSGSVHGFTDPSQLKSNPGVVPIYIRQPNNSNLPNSVLGCHKWINGQSVPSAVVDYQSGGLWSITASHEILEILLDPSLGQWVPSGIPADPRSFLREVCDPCLGVTYTPPNSSIYLSDFCLPDYYSPQPVNNRFTYAQAYTDQSNSLQPIGFSNGSFAYASGSITFRSPKNDGSGDYDYGQIDAMGDVTPSPNLAILLSNAEHLFGVRGCVDRDPALKHPFIITSPSPKKKMKMSSTPTPFHRELTKWIKSLSSKKYTKALNSTKKRVKAKATSHEK